MTSIKKLGSSYIISTTYNTFLFDYTMVSCPFVDTIFISNSSNIEILYITFDLPIYITEPVYTQLLYKHKLQSTQEISPLFYKNCIFINYNQILKFNTTEITVLSSGLYFGWCMFKINESLLYFSDISFTNKLCTKNSDIQDVQYILWGNSSKEKKKDHIENFNNAFNSSLISEKNALKSKNNIAMHFLNRTVNSTVEIYVEFPNFLLDIVLHINSFFSKAVNIDCPHIGEYINNVKSSSDWINDKFSKIHFNIDEESKILIKNLEPNENDHTIRVSGDPDIFFNIDTKASKLEISKKTRGSILDLQENVYYSLQDTEYEDFFVDGNIDISENTGYIMGDMTNTDKFEYNKKVSLPTNVDFIKYLFDMEKYVAIGGIYYFKRLGIKVCEDKEGFRIKL